MVRKQHRQWARSTPRYAIAVLVGFSIATALVGPVGVALAQAPPGDSSVIQYTELVPTGQGAKAPGVGKKTKAKLPANAKKALAKEPAKTAQALTVIATSSDYGAPATSPPTQAATKSTPRPGKKPKPTAKAATEHVPVSRDKPVATKAPSLDRTLSATAAAVSPVGDDRFVGLIVAIIAIAVTGVALAARAHRP